MRKKTQKLTLSRETIRNLSLLQSVEGAVFQDTLEGASCFRRICPNGPEPVPSVDGCSNALACASDNGQCPSGLTC